MQYKKSPSVKQLKAIQLINQGFPIARAMRQAGYSQSSSEQSDKFLKMRGVQEAITTMPGDLMSVGLTKRYVALKLKEQMDATKIHTSHTEPDKEIPDNMARLKAIDKWHQFMKEGEKNGVKRRMTIEEFVNDGVEEKEPVWGEEE